MGSCELLSKLQSEQCGILKISVAKEIHILITDNNLKNLLTDEKHIVHGKTSLGRHFVDPFVNQS